MSKIAFKGGKLVDGTGASPVEDSLVLVDDKKIAYAGPATEIPEGYEVRDISGRTIMPGIIDTHIHFSGNLTDNDNDWVIETVAQKQACAVKQAYDAVTHGLTTVCEIGRNGIAIRDLVNMGVMKGPRIFATGLGFCRTAGHGDCHKLPFEMSKTGHPWGDQVDGPWELRHAIRMRLRENPDAIKIWATGGGIWRWDSGRAQLYSSEEIKAVCDECAMIGIPVWSHSYNSISAAYDSVRFGCEQLIHGFELDDKTMDLMAQQGTFFTPTVGFLPSWSQRTRRSGLPSWTSGPARTTPRRASRARTPTSTVRTSWVSRSPWAPTPSASRRRMATPRWTRFTRGSSIATFPLWTPSLPLRSTAPRWSTTRTSSARSRRASTPTCSLSTAIRLPTFATSRPTTWRSS